MNEYTEVKGTLELVSRKIFISDIEMMKELSSLGYPAGFVAGVFCKNCGQYVRINGDERCCDNYEYQGYNYPGKRYYTITPEMIRFTHKRAEKVIKERHEILS